MVATQLQKVSSVCIFQLTPNPPFCIFSYFKLSTLCVHLFLSDDVCLCTVYMSRLSVLCFVAIPLAQLSFCLSLLCASHSFIQSPEALEKNKQWLEYDQQREAYVRAVLARMLWLEKQLNEANQARSEQHNEDLSDGEPEG